MDKTYNHQEVEEKIYKNWEESGYFTPKIDFGKKPFTILLPPPNANAPLHMGHAMYVVEDILVRFHRMLGDPTLFLPGTDHAGIETQFVFEKKLKEEGKSRFDFDRNTLYKMVNEYVEKNRGIAKGQLKRLGFSLDWTRERYTLDPEILKTVFNTFKKLYKDGLIYRDQKIVNYCTYCGTAFSELEVEHVEKEDLIYYLDYGVIQIATTRPETIFADVAVAVNPNDKRYKDLTNKEAVIPIINKKIPIIKDEAVETEFGTGALKITPAHDPVDFEIGQRHNLPKISVIGLDGKMINVPKELDGLYVKQARRKIQELLEREKKLIKTEPIKHIVGVCYRCKNVIEPLLLPQWFVKIKPLAKPAIDVVKKKRTLIFPSRFKKIYLDWMENIRDWNISRQIVWGPRIPAWYCLDCNENITINFINKKGELISGRYKEIKQKYSFEEIKNGLQTLTAPVEAEFTVEEEKECEKCKGSSVLQETDTFDTWFSSGQWPLTTLGYPNSTDFKYFYPTSVLDTMWDILPFWVSRMIMFGMYQAHEVPFKVAHMHSRVVDAKHQKMSKSKGNVINPIDVVEKYGADALRLALVFGTAPASDVVITEDKIRAMRNFSNKLWNMGRFIQFQKEKIGKKELKVKEELNELLKLAKIEKDREIIEKTQKLVKSVTEDIDKYNFNYAAENLYEFAWHEFADKYIEDVKNRIDDNSFIVLNSIFLTILKLIHPFMPFVTEEIYQRLGFKGSIIVSSWPNES